MGIEKTNKLEHTEELKKQIGETLSPTPWAVRAGRTSRCVKTFGYAILIHSLLLPLDGHSSSFPGYESRPFSNSSQILQQDSFFLFAHGPEPIDR